MGDLAAQPRIEQQEGLEDRGQPSGIESGRIDVEVQPQGTDPGRAMTDGTGIPQDVDRLVHLGEPRDHHGGGDQLARDEAAQERAQPRGGPRSQLDGKRAAVLLRVHVADIELNREIAEVGPLHEERVRVLLHHGAAEPGGERPGCSAGIDAHELDLDADTAGGSLDRGQLRRQVDHGTDGVADATRPGRSLETSARERDLSSSNRWHASGSSAL
jgi:hypothetical protein